MSHASSGSGAAGDSATVRALTVARATTRSQADELLTHVPVVGDLTGQRLLDGWVEQAADTLRALSEALEERLIDLGTGGRSAVDGGPAAGAPAAGPSPQRQSGVQWPGTPPAQARR